MPKTYRAYLRQLQTRVPDSATYGDGSAASVAAGQVVLDNKLDTITTNLATVDGIADNLLVRLPNTATYGDGTAANVATGQVVLDNKLDSLITRNPDSATYGGGSASDIATGQVVLWNQGPKSCSTNVTAAANAGATNVGTVATGAVWVQSVAVRSNGATTADLTSAAISAGGAAGTATILSGLDAATVVKASIDADGEFLVYTGQPFMLDAADTLSMDLQGTGATAVDLDVDILYYAVGTGGTIA